MKNCPVIFLLLFVILGSTILHAQWIQTGGPYGGAVTAFAFKDGYTFAGTAYGGVYRSTDHGTSWAAVNSNLSGKSIISLAVNATYLFAGIPGDGVYRSSNYGTNWSKVNTGLSNLGVTSLVIKGSYLFAGTSAGTFRSSNDGTNWSPVGLSANLITSLATDGIANIFAGTLSEGVYISNNDGSSWTQVNSGLPASGLSITTIAVDGSDIFAGTNGSGVYYSNNSGSSWAAVNNPNLTGFENITSIIINGSNIFAGTSAVGIYHSTDGGLSWSQLNNGLTGMYVNTLGINGTNLFTGVNGFGVFRSTFDGTNWTDWSKVNNGLSASYISSLIIDGSNIFAGTADIGVLRSTDNGSNWNEVNTGIPVEVTAVYSLLIKGSSFYAGASDGVYLSDKGILDWIQINSGIAPNTHVLSLVSIGSYVFAATNHGVYRLSDGETTWTECNYDLSDTDVGRLAVIGTNLFAATYSGGVFLSTDYGAHWSAVNTGLDNFNAFSLAAKGTSLFVNVNTGLFRSDNNGTNWTLVSKSPLEASAPVWSYVVNGTDLFTGSNGCVFRSTDNGANWSTVATGLPDFFIDALALDGTYIYAGTMGNSIYRRPLSDPAMPVEITSFSAEKDGNYIKLNWGTATEVNNYGFEVERQVSSMQNTVGNQNNPQSAIHNPQWDVVGFVEGSGNSNSPKQYTFIDENPPAGTLQYRLKQIDTDGSSQYYVNIAEIVNSLTNVEENKVPYEFGLLQNYPNPFNPSTVIRYQIPVGTRHGVFVQLCIYDVLGKEVAALVNEPKQPGAYEVEFNGSSLPSGLYFYKITCGKYSEVKKMILLR